MKLRDPIIVANVRNYIKVKSIITTFYNSELHVIQNITILVIDFRLQFKNLQEPLYYIREMSYL